MTIAHRRPVTRSPNQQSHPAFIEDKDGEKKRDNADKGNPGSSKCLLLLGKLYVLGANCCTKFFACTVVKYRRKTDMGLIFHRGLKVYRSFQREGNGWNCIRIMNGVTDGLPWSNCTRNNRSLTLAMYSIAGFLLLMARHTIIYSGVREELSIPVVIKALDYTSLIDKDVGGFIYPNRRQLVMKVISQKLNNIEINNTNQLPDYGGLLFPFSDLRNLSSHKNESSVQQDKHVSEKKKSKATIARRWADDDFVQASMANSFAKPRCRHASWHKLHFPNCNAFHEMDISRHRDSQFAFGRYHTDDDTVSLSHGYYRDTWLVGQAKVENQRDAFYKYDTVDTNVLKTLRYSKHDVNVKTMDHVRRDALIMERLSSSPRIIDIYGYCGTSMSVEFIENEIEEKIVPGSGYMKEDLQKMHDWNDVQPRNTFTPEEKLDLALSMAESLADLHGFKDGVIVHDDVQLCQWLMKKSTGKLKLGDFNRAGLMLFDEEKGKYCKYSNGNCYGNYRAPEEFAAKPLDESIDVFSFGNNIYALLTGLWVFYTNEDDEVVQVSIGNCMRKCIEF